MNNSRLEFKVGLFVFIGLVLLAVLMLQFSKGVTFFRDTYQLRLHALDVGGLKKRAQVLMSGVQVGTVADITLAADGKSVTILLKIYGDYKNLIRSDAEFAIEASGFLGDQYVSINPTENLGDPLKDNDDVTCEKPLNIQEVARDAAGFIKRVDEAARKVDDSMSDLRRWVLNEQNLTNVAVTVDNLRAVSARALEAVDRINALVDTNGEAISYSASNLVQFSDELTRFSGSLNDILATNRETVSAAVKNVESSSETLRNILEDARAGKGLAGTLLHNDNVAAKAAEIVNNLSITSSNLNQLGLWRVLFPKHPRSTAAPPSAAPRQSPKDRAR